MELLKQRINANANFEQLATPLFPKKNLLVEVTNYCNHACVFCYNSKMTRIKRFIEKKLAYDVLRQAYDLGTREVGFYATGEPLMNKNIAEFVSYTKSLGFEYVYITTNGALLSKEKTIELTAAGIDSIKFSINAGTAETYKKIHGRDDFKKVIDNLRFFDEYRKQKRIKVNLFVSYIVNKSNVSEIGSLRDKVGTFADDVVFINMVNQTGLMYEETQRMKLSNEQLKKFEGIKSAIQIPCAQLFNAATISCEGYLTACCADFQNYLAVADLHEMTLKEAWESKTFAELRERHLNGNVEGTICYNCAYDKNTPIYPIDCRYATLIK
ncbi:radical SAM protein [Selenomonas sp. AB3002]|uniref:radical SAM/SPASM domain-containing protein n=1 Tax=Selenomonas sp. AB3002 TaxID=1392502 RepID=UPI0004959445